MVPRGRIFTQGNAEQPTTETVSLYLKSDTLSGGNLHGDIIRHAPPLGSCRTSASGLLPLEICPHRVAYATRGNELLR